MTAQPMFRVVVASLVSLGIGCTSPAPAPAPAVPAAAPAALSSEDITRQIEGMPAWIEIDLDALGANLDAIRKHTGVDVMPVVKNNAYGHGLVPVSRYLASRGVTKLFVAKFDEALELRAAGITAAVVNMGPLFSTEQYARAVAQQITQTVFTDEAADALSAAAVASGAKAHVFVKIDTGLRRVGVFHDVAADFVERVSKRPGISIDGMFSTFTQTPEQDKIALERFLQVDQALKAKGVSVGARSMASSDAMFHFPASHLDLVRPGMSLYGVYPEEKDVKAGVALRQALTFKARIQLVKPVQKGDSVTYWGRFIAPKPMSIGTVHVGFYDGVPRESGNKGKVRFEGGYRPIIGSVSLNHIIVDLTGTNARIGDVVEVIGAEGENSLSAVAKDAGWMVYSLLNHLNAKTPRVYTQQGRPVSLWPAP